MISSSSLTRLFSFFSLTNQTQSESCTMIHTDNTTKAPYTVGSEIVESLNRMLLKAVDASANGINRPMCWRKTGMPSKGHMTPEIQGKSSGVCRRVTSSTHRLRTLLDRRRIAPRSKTQTMIAWRWKVKVRRKARRILSGAKSMLAKLRSSLSFAVTRGRKSCKRCIREIEWVE